MPNRSSEAPATGKGEVVKVARIEIDGPEGKKHKLALSDEMFAVHPSYFDDDEGGLLQQYYAVTHLPTGYALTTGFTWDEALHCLEVLAERGYDEWHFSSKEHAERLVPTWKAIKAEIKARVERKGPDDAGSETQEG
jgi:hypothetical protein